MIFAKQYRKDPESKICGWLEAKVKETLANYSKRKQNVQTIDNLAFTIWNGLYPAIVVRTAVARTP